MQEVSSTGSRSSGNSRDFVLDPGQNPCYQTALVPSWCVGHDDVFSRNWQHGNMSLMLAATEKSEEGGCHGESKRPRNLWELLSWGSQNYFCWTPGYYCSEMEKKARDQWFVTTFVTSFLWPQQHCKGRSFGISSKVTDEKTKTWNWQWSW